MTSYSDKHLYASILVLLHLSSSLQDHHGCSKEEEKGIHDITWESKSSSPYTLVLSDPPCYDKTKQLIYRICLNGNWIKTEKQCYQIEESKLCPPEFKQVEDHCIYITKPQTWERNCPVAGGFSKVKNSYVNAWLPVRRKILYGSYEHVLPGEKYGSKFTEPALAKLGDNLTLNCVITTANGVLPTTCDVKYSHVCSYKYNEFLYKCPDGCVPGGLGSNYCFCKVKQKQTVCAKLAVATYSRERSILQQLASDDTCLIGNFQPYTTDYVASNHLFLGVSKNSFSLHHTNLLKCSICTVDPLIYYPASLVLKFKPEAQKLYLMVYSPESLVKIKDNTLVYCFTNAQGNLKQRLDVEKLWKSNMDPTSSQKMTVFEVSIEEKYPGAYWCEAFELPNFEIVKSNQAVASKKFYGHEYALRLQIQRICRFSAEECKNPSISFIGKIGEQLFDDNFFSKFIKRVRLFHVYKINKVHESVDVLLHLSSETKIPLVREYHVISSNLFRLVLKGALVVFFRSSEVCLPDITTSGTTVLKWKISAIGIVRIPEELCVQENLLPVRRQCNGNFTFGSIWGDVEGRCSKNAHFSQITEMLHSLRLETLTNSLPKSISMITENSTDLTILDLYYISDLLIKMRSLNESSSITSIEEVSEIVDNLIKTSNRSIMKQSQLHLNVTDEILDTLEEFLKATNTTKDLLTLKRNNLVIQFSKPFLNGISGLAIYGQGEGSFETSQIVSVGVNASVDSFRDDPNLEVATFVPGQLLELLTKNLSEEVKCELIVITTVYYNDKFFNSLNENDSIASRVVSVLIPGFGEYLEEPIVVIFKSKMRARMECAYWNYGMNSESYYGYWSLLGGNYMGELSNSTVDGCSYSHLTNFALLVRTDDLSASEEEVLMYDLTTEKHDQVLTLISDIGCCLSLIGIMGIFATNVMFKSWREKVGTKILIQLCITILLQIIIINFANVSNASVISKDYCTIIGVVLHYVLIAEFAWMLVAAILQFFRFVQVIGPMPSRLFLKAMLVGWGLPLIPIIIVCAADYDSYAAGVQGFCYPKGYGLYFGVLLPIAIIVSANLGVFVLVIRNVFLLKIEAQNNSNTILRRQLCLAVLLFFLLGLPWIFGLFSELLDHDSVLSYTFIYLFCITATLQGFVLFIFYVILDKNTRLLWLHQIKRTMNQSFT